MGFMNMKGNGGKVAFATKHLLKVLIGKFCEKLLTFYVKLIRIQKFVSSGSSYYPTDRVGRLIGLMLWCHEL